jgi:hypothetical protein
MRVLIAVLAIALLTVSAHAQKMGKGQRQQQKVQRTHDPAKDKAAEQAYQDALKKSPDASDKPDPWKGMR